MSYPHDHVAHLSREVLSYAAWLGMCGDRYDARQRPPEAMQAGCAAFGRLPEADATLAREFGKGVWTYVSDAVGTVADPSDIGSARERAMAKQLRLDLPFIDEWTHGVMWNVAFRQWMM
jgi:hypothetical protein